VTADDPDADGFTMEVGREYPGTIYPPSVTRQLVGKALEVRGGWGRIVAASVTPDGRAIEIAVRILPDDPEAIE
jgi:hypothetical protein